MQEAAEDYLKQQYEIAKYDYEIKNGIPTTAKEYDKLKDSILGNVQAGTAMYNAYDNLLKQDFSGYIDTQTKQVETEYFFPEKWSIENLYNTEPYSSEEDLVWMDKETLHKILSQYDDNDIIG